MLDVAGAQVPPPVLRRARHPAHVVQRDRRVGVALADPLEDLELVRLLGLRMRRSASSALTLAEQRQLLLDDLVHLLLDAPQVLVRERRHVEVVVEPLLDPRPDRHLRRPTACTAIAITCAVVWRILGASLSSLVACGPAAAAARRSPPRAPPAPRPPWWASCAWRPRRHRGRAAAGAPAGDAQLDPGGPSDAGEIAIAVHSRRIGQPEGAAEVATTSAQLTQLVRDREASVARRPCDRRRVAGDAAATDVHLRDRRSLRGIGLALSKGCCSAAARSLRAAANPSRATTARCRTIFRRKHGRNRST